MFDLAIPDSASGECLGLPVAEPPKKPDYILTYPVPGPDTPGEYAFFTVTPEGRQLMVCVDRIQYEHRAVTGYLGDVPLITVPKEAPWAYVRRSLFQYMDREQADKAALESFKSRLAAAAGGPEGAEPGAFLHTGQYA